MRNVDGMVHTVSLILAIISSLCFAVGMFLTKGVTLQISVYKAIGPLFILNALFVVPLIPFGPRWIVWTGSIPYLHIVGAVCSGLAAAIIFTMVSRSTASVVTVGQAISPAVVLILAPFTLGNHIFPAQIIAVIVLVLAIVFPLRKSLVGVSSFLTVFLMVLLGLVGGVVTIAVALLYRQGVGTSETFIIRQTLAGIVFMIIYPPKGLCLRDFMQLVRRSFFMSIGWLTSIYAIQKGSPILVQSLMAAIPIWVILIETVVYRKLPKPPVIFSALVIAVGIYALALTS